MDERSGTDGRSRPQAEATRSEGDEQGSSQSAAAGTETQEVTAVLYDAQEYMIAGLDNQAEWWEHPGDACHLYRRPEMALLYDSLGVRCPHAGAREEVT